MITSAEEYLRYLYQIQDSNFPTQAILLPTNETIYNVDLNSRIIEAPEVLSAERDHYAETIYFSVDRYFDNCDLTNTVCLIQYINETAVAEGTAPGGYAYAVPFYDVTHLAEENKILIPWCIGGPATAAAGNVKFAIQFYRVNETGTEFTYNLNTQPATSKILYSMNVVTEDNENFIIPDTTVELIFQRINDIEDHVDLKWIEAY